MSLYDFEKEIVGVDNVIRQRQVWYIRGVTGTFGVGRAQGKWHPWAMVSKQDSVMKDAIVIHNNGSYWLNLIVLVLCV